MINFFAISGLVNALAALIFGAFVYFKNKRGQVNKAFLYMSFSIFIWGMGYWTVMANQTKDWAVFGQRMVDFGSSFIPITFFHYSAALLGLYESHKKIINLGYLFNGCLAMLAFTPLLTRDMAPKLIFKYWPIAGYAYPVFLLAFFGWVTYSYYLMFKQYKSSSGVTRNQIKYVIWSTLIGFGGGSTNYPLWYDIPMLPIGNPLVCLYTVGLGIAIIRYRLFEIETVIHRTILWILTSCLILIPLGIMLFLIRTWLATLTWLQLTFLMTGLFYVFLFYYRKAQPHIDHLFRRRKYDYYAVLSEVGQKIGSELDINNVVSRLFKELKDILYIRNGLALVQLPGQEDYTEVDSTGYSTILDSKKEEKTVLRYKDQISQWLQIHQKSLEREQVEVDPQYTPIKEEALSFLNQNSLELLIPVIMEGKVNALVGIGKKENLQAYTIKDIELLENMGRQIGITIDNAMHHEDIVEKERLAEEMKLGREIQMALLPRELPVIKGLSVQGLMQPAKEIGGDYYDFVTLPNKDHLAVVIGDVSGKGVAAGLLMAMAKTAIHTLSQDEASPKQILLRTNAILNQHIGGQKFMTMLYFRYDSINRTFTYSSAGHEHILIYRNKLASERVVPQGTSPNVETIMSGGFMLGMIPDIAQFLEDKTIILNPKDKIILYTDGVTEARNSQEGLFGLPRLIDLVSKYGFKPASELLSSIKDDVYSFIGTREQFDDITLVVMEAV